MKEIKTFHSGVCVAYGSAFKMPVIIQVDEPNPVPLSQNVNISKVWYIKGQ